MHECHLKICQRKYDKGHHANPTMAIDLLWIQICYLYYTKYIWKYLYHERKVAFGGHQVQRNLLMIMKVPISKKR